MKQNKLTAVSDGQKIKIMIWYCLSQKMVPSVIKYLDKVGKEEEGDKYVGIWYDVNFKSQ